MMAAAGESPLLGAPEPPWETNPHRRLSFTVHAGFRACLIFQTR